MFLAQLGDGSTMEHMRIHNFLLSLTSSWEDQKRSFMNFSTMKPMIDLKLSNLSNMLKDSYMLKTDVLI